TSTLLQWTRVPSGARQCAASCGQSPTVQELTNALIQVWEEIPQDTVRQLIRSMARLCWVLYIPVMTRLSRRTCTNQLRALSALAVLRVIANLTELSAVLTTTTLKISRSSQRSRLPPP
ncbi:unnamed protein product, partial [Pleuronectes platessa]